MKKFDTTKFTGVVHLKDGFWHSDGKHFVSVFGTVSTLEAKKVTGFDVKGTESNWLARVSSKDGETSISLLGCQIRSIFQGQLHGNIAPNCMNLWDYK